MPDRVTYGQLYQLLLDLEFVDQPAEERWKVFRHEGSNTLILLGGRDRTSPAREADLLSVRRHLLENGLIEENEFEDFVSHGRLAHSG